MIARKERGQVMIILATWWLLFGGGGSSALVVYERSASDIKKAVKRVVPGGERRDAILARLSQWESVQEKQDEKVSADRKELLELLQRQQTQRSELDPLLARLDETLLVMDWDFLNFRFQVKEQVTGAEWAALVAPAGR
jgi:hypothetical protein